jgi:integrase
MATIRKLRGRWQAMVRRKGTAPRSKSFDKKTDAEKWARDLEAEVDRCGVLPDTRVAEDTTLADIMTRYRDEVTPRKRGAKIEVFRINAMLRHDIMHRTLTLLSSSDIAAYRDERLQTVGAAAVVREIATISQAIDTAMKDWNIYLARNPAKLVRRPSLPRGRDRRLEGDEEQRILAACDRGRIRWLKPMVVLAVETSMRRGEMLSLRWSNIDLDRRVAHLSMTKNGSSRDVPLSTRAVETLTELMQQSDRDPEQVFAVSENAVRLAWNRLRSRIGLDNINFHDLRHEGVSRLFEKGLDVMEVSAISGHKTLSMLKRYTHLRAEDLALRLG